MDQIATFYRQKIMLTSSKKPHILIYGHYFPNQVEPSFANFIVTNLEQYPDDIEYKVLAPVPFFLNKRRGKNDIQIPQHEFIQIGIRQIEIYRPRFWLFPRNILRAGIGWLEYITTMKTIRTINLDWKIDLVHVNFAQPDGIAARLICRKLNIPYVITEHQGAIASFLSKPLLRKQILSVYKDAAKAIVVSEYTRQAINGYNTKGIDLLVIPNGIMTVDYLLKAKKSKPVNLVFVGNLIETKGIHILIKAFAQLKTTHQDIRLTIIGGGKYRNELETLVRELGLSDSVDFSGIMSHNEITHILPDYDLLILPSFIESFGIVLLEAMACGLPVLSTRCGGPEYIVTESTGILAKPNSVQDLYQGLQTMLNKWSEYDPLIIRKYVQDNFDLPKIIKLISCVYYQLLGVYTDGERDKN
jgi:glycosyltransferase involved in cell wall biosynthesis